MLSVAMTGREALDEGILDRLARRDEVPIDGVVLAPGQYGVAGEPVPLLETMEPGLPRQATSDVSSRATRRPEIDVSGMRPDIPW